MARKKGSLGRKTLAKMGKLDPSLLNLTPQEYQKLQKGYTTPSCAPLPELVDDRTDSEIIREIIKRFEMLQRFLVGVMEGVMPSLTVSGGAGIGKSFTTESMLLARQREKGERFKFYISKGVITPIELFELAYEHRFSGNVLVLDDADNLFEDETGLNLVKALTDSSRIRRVTWHSDHAKFRGDDGIPNEYEFQGAFVFLTNKDMQREIDSGWGQRVAHLQALQSRTIYLDLAMHSRREVLLWVLHMLDTKKIIQKERGVTAAQEKQAILWLREHLDDLREISIRTGLKLGTFMTMDPTNWEDAAETTLLYNKYRPKPGGK